MVFSILKIIFYFMEKELQIGMKKAKLILIYTIQNPIIT